MKIKNIRINHVSICTKIEIILFANHVRQRWFVLLRIITLNCFLYMNFHNQWKPCFCQLVIFPIESGTGRFHSGSLKIDVGSLKRDKTSLNFALRSSIHGSILFIFKYLYSVIHSITIPMHIHRIAQRTTIHEYLMRQFTL